MIERAPAAPLLRTTGEVSSPQQRHGTMSLRPVRSRDWARHTLHMQHHPSTMSTGPIAARQQHRVTPRIRPYHIEQSGCVA